MKSNLHSLIALQGPNDRWSGASFLGGAAVLVTEAPGDRYPTNQHALQRRGIDAVWPTFPLPWNNTELLVRPVGSMGGGAVIKNI